MQQAYDIASKTAAREAFRGKRGYDKRVHGADLQPGGRVLVHNLSERGGPGKLRSYWENKVHVVVKRRSSDSPVYEVVPEGGGKSRVLHRNLLLPCNSLPLDKPGTDPKQKGRRNQTQTRIRQRRTNRQVEGSDSESSEDIELVCRFPHYQQPSQRAVELNPDAELFVPDLGKQEREPEHEEVEADIMNITPEADGEDNAAESGEGLQESSEEPASEEDDP